jgi:galactosylceramidase
MGRISHVGSGWGIVPKGYLFELGADGKCSLKVVRGIKEQNQPSGDAEQQALIKAGKDEAEGGEKDLATIGLSGIKPNTWHTMKLRFDGITITGFVDGKQVLSTTDRLYSHGMVGLIVGGGKTFSMPYFDNLILQGLNAPKPSPSVPARDQFPIYRPTDPVRQSTRHRRFRARKG